MSQADVSPTFFQQIAELSPDIVCRIRLQPALAFEYLSPAVTAVTGYTPEQYYAEPELAQRVVLPEDRTRLWQLIAGSAPVDTACVRCTASNGHIAVLDLHFALERDGDGRPVRLNGIARNVSEVEQLHAALRRQTALIDGTTDAIISTDPDGAVVSWNPGAERLYGYSAAEAKGRSVYALWSFDPSPKSTALIEPAHFPHIRGKGKDGQTLDVNVSLFPLQNDEGCVTGLAAVSRDIGEEIAAQQTIAQAAAIVESTDEAIIGKDIDGIVMSWNHGAELLYGYTAVEAIGQPIDILFPLEHVDDFPQIMARILSGERIQQFETVRRTKDGRLLDVALTISPIRNFDGEVIGASTIARDISVRKQIEAALRQSERHYRLLAENMRDVVWVLDVETMCFTYVSPSVEKLRGFTPEEVMAQSATDALTPESSARLASLMQEEIARFLAGDLASSSVTELEQPCRDGSTVWTETVGIYFINPDTGHLEAYGVSRDISERRRIEAAMRESEERFRLVVTNSADMFLLYDQEGRLRYVSPAFTRITGYSPDELLQVHTELAEGRGSGREDPLVQPPIPTISNLVHPDDRAVTRAALASCTKFPGRETLFEYRMQTRQGDYRYLEAVAQGLVSEHGNFTGVLLTTRDITERKAMEQELRMLNEHLEQRVAARTADLEMAMAQLQRADQAKDAFMAAVSHELRTPLMGVLGMTELLLEQPDGLSGRQAHYAATIHASGERLLTLVNSILSYTSLVSGRVQIRPENCHLAELCAISLRSVTARAERKQQQLEVDVSPVDLAIVSDVDGIIQILKKLLDNAIKFTPDGGSVGLKVGATQDGDAVQLDVRDTGIGIPPEKTAMLFQAFSQIDGGLARPFDGVGLGLAYAKKMIEMLGGTIAVASTPGQGSTFTVTLPRVFPENGHSIA